MAETVFSNLRARGTLTVVGLATLALVTLSNTLTLQKTVNFTPDGTSTGAVIQVNGVTEIQAYTVPCTATGAGTYDTCLMPPILTTTGAIKEISLMIANSPKVVSLDCGFVKSRKAATGASLSNFDNVSTATGSIRRHTAGSGGLAYRWNPADYIKCGTAVDPTSSFSGYLRVEFYDDRSE